MEEASRATKHSSLLVAVKHHTSSAVYKSRALELWEWKLVLYGDTNISGDMLQFIFLNNTDIPLYKTLQQVGKTAKPREPQKMLQSKSFIG